MLHQQINKTKTENVLDLTFIGESKESVSIECQWLGFPLVSLLTDYVLASLVALTCSYLFFNQELGYCALTLLILKSKYTLTSFLIDLYI